MSTPAPYLAPSLVRLTRERDVKWRKLRSLNRPAMEGWLGDAAHRARKSGHNPDAKGCVHARDYDVRGMVVADFLARVIGDPRVWYVIYNSTIWSRKQEWVPQKYNGPSPHTDHIHVSIINNQETRPFTDAEVKYAETTTTGFGLASLITPAMVVRVTRRLMRRGY